MTNPVAGLTTRRTVVIGAGVALAFLGSGEGAGAALAPVGLGTATSFAVLAGSRVTNTGATTVSGDLGVSPGTAVTGFPPGVVSNGTIHAADAVALQAQADLTTAYNDAAGRASSATISADLGGRTLVSGVYSGTTLGLTGTLTLDAQGDAGAVFIFQSASTLITATSSSVSLINGASACNVFWQVGSSATLGTTSTFVGSVLALTSISATTGTTVEGRLLARNGAVTLDSNLITRPACAALPPGSTTTTVPGPSTTVPDPTTTVPAPTTTMAPGTTVPGSTSTIPPATTTTLPATTTTTTVPATTTSAPSSTMPATTTTTAEALSQQPGVPATTTTSRPRTTGGGSSTGRTSTTSRTVRLARTGSALTSASVAGLLALLTGIVLVSASRVRRPDRS